MKKIRRRREGMTLVELIVSLALLSILMVMVVGVVSPAAKTFARMQQLQFAQLVLDNVEDEIKSQLQDAAGNIKIYNVSDDGTMVNATGSDIGSVLEYVNTDSYVVLMSAEGCGETTLMQSGQVIGKESAAAGRAAAALLLAECGLVPRQRLINIIILWAVSLWPGRRSRFLPINTIWDAI